jgi:hypothetical protein
MTTRYQAKINGGYDIIQADTPATTFADGTRWLQTTTGDSYTLSSGAWVQIETAIDAKIDLMLTPTYSRVVADCIASLSTQRHDELDDAPDTISYNALWYLNAYVSVYADWTISGASISVTDADDIVGSVDDFEYEDYAYIYGSRRNDGVHQVESVDAAGLTFGATLVDGDDSFVVLMVAQPVDLDLIVGRMIYYDVVTRPGLTGIVSERIGSYSYTLEDRTIGGLRYPSDVVAGIDTYLDSGPIVDARFTP